jgi:Protein of unknown function (DUF3151)
VSVNSESTRPISLSGTGLPTTILPAADAAARASLDNALTSPPVDRRTAVSEVVANHPRYIDAWVALGDLGRDTIERYAAYRVGYHRGLDALRGSGWRGSGYVRWAAPSNRGFLNALVGLMSMADSIGELDESERIGLFLMQLDPSGVPSDAADCR